MECFPGKQSKGFKYVAPAVYDELEEITGLERSTIHNYKSIAESTAEVRESSPRGEQLNFSHYREVAPLEPEQQEYFLNKASEEKLSVRQLRKEMRKTDEEKRKEMRALHSLNNRLAIEKRINSY